MTDANLVLGYLDPGNFLGGRARLDVGAAQRAVDAIAERLGTDRMVAAEGIHRVINTVMAEGIRVVSVRRGVDPRRFALLAFGGAAALHVTDVARRLEIGRVVVPRVAAVLSAWGMLATDLRYEVGADPHRRRAPRRGGAAAPGVRRHGGRGPATARPRRSRGRCAIQRAVDMRYGEQIFEINVPLDGRRPGRAPTRWRRSSRASTSATRSSTRTAAPDQEVVLVNARLAVVGELPALPEEPALPSAVRPQRPAASGASTWTSGARCRSTISTR